MSTPRLHQHCCLGRRRKLLPSFDFSHFCLDPHLSPSAHLAEWLSGCYSVTLGGGAAESTAFSTKREKRGEQTPCAEQVRGEFECSNALLNSCRVVLRIGLRIDLRFSGSISVWNVKRRCRRPHQIRSQSLSKHLTIKIAKIIGR